jgi:excisionase family DNA binding protein
VSDPSSTEKRRKREPAYLSQTAFAEHLDVSRVTVWRWVRDGRVRSIRISPSIIRIPLTEVERLGQQPAHKRPSPRKRLDAEQQDDDPQGDPTETD